MDPKPLTWAALFALVTATSGCSTVPACNTDRLPVDDPCYQRSCCDQVQVRTLPDGGTESVPDGADGGPGTTYRLCGACNG